MKPSHNLNSLFPPNNKETNRDNMQRNTSSALMQRAQLSIPGGVNSPVRAFKGVGGDPIFFLVLRPI